MVNLPKHGKDFVLNSEWIGKPLEGFEQTSDLNWLINVTADIYISVLIGRKATLVFQERDPREWTKSVAGKLARQSKGLDISVRAI